MKHNGSMYAHIFFARSGFSPDPSHPEYDQSASFNKSHCKLAKTVWSHYGALQFLPNHSASSDLQQLLLCSLAPGAANEVPKVVQSGKTNPIHFG